MKRCHCRIRFAILIPFLLLANAHAEYRVYQYMVYSSSFDGKEKYASLIHSTLDPRSYLAYHGLDALHIDLLNSWVCYGHTGHQQTYCASPEQTARLENGTIEEKPTP